MPDHWDTRPENLFTPQMSSPTRPPTTPPPQRLRDHTNEIRLKDPSGRLRLPAYILIALGIALVALLLVAVGLLLALK